MSSTMNERDTRPMPAIRSARVLDKLCVELEWAEGPRAGKTEIVDLSPAINRYKVYKPLRAAPDLFATLAVEDDGSVLEWDDGAIDMAATTVEHLAEEQMTGVEFRAFLERHRLTRREAAAQLGRSLRQVQTYANSDAPLPRAVALACRGYEAGKRPEPAGR